ncbi:hypothetical protein AFK68_13150 [Hydrocoleum sp. CS-953]|nr:hypothetical protein AFK68_13150 [Hydrocoleum sp. CS-953]
MYLIKIILLFVLGVILITEPIKKSLVPLGCLIFAVATNFLMNEADSVGSLYHLSIPNHAINFVYISTTKKALYIGVNITIITWLLFIIFWEAIIRFIILSQRKIKPDERANNK